MLEDILTTPKGDRKSRLSSFKQRLKDFEQGKTDLSEFRGTGTFDTQYKIPEYIDTPEYNRDDKVESTNPNQDIYQPQTNSNNNFNPIQIPEVNNQQSSNTDGWLDTYADITAKSLSSPWSTFKDMFGSLASEKNVINNSTLRGDIYRNINPKLDAINQIENYKKLENDLNTVGNLIERGEANQDNSKYYALYNDLSNKLAIAKEKAKDALVFIKTNEGGSEHKFRSTEDYTDPNIKQAIIGSQQNLPEEWATGWSDNKINNRVVGTSKVEFNFTKNMSDPKFLEYLDNEKKNLIEKKNNNLKSIDTNNQDIQYWKSLVSSDYLNKRGNTNNWLEYAFYEVPALAGSSFSNLKERALATGTGMLSGMLTGSGAGPIGTVAGGAAALASGYYTMESRKKESLSELSEAYEGKLRDFYKQKGLDENTLTPDIFKQITGVDPSSLPSKPKTSEELFQSLMMRESNVNDPDFNDQLDNYEKRSLTGANVLYDLNNTLGALDAAQIFINAFPVGRALASNIKLPSATGSLLRESELVLDNIAEAGIKHSTNKLKNITAKGVIKASELWNKTPDILKSGFNLSKKTLANAISEGAEEGAQFTFQEQYKAGQYDDPDSMDLKEIVRRSLNSNYKVYGTILGFNPDPLLKDNDEFWENVKGGFALGLGMGGGYTALEKGLDFAANYRANSRQTSANAFVKNTVLPDILRQAALDQVVQQDNMNKAKMYIDQISKGRSENVLKAFQNMKENLPKGVNEKDIDDEINRFNKIRQYTDKDLAKQTGQLPMYNYIDSIRKGANIDKGTIQHGVLIGLIDRYNNELEENNKVLQDSKNEVNQTLTSQNINSFVSNIDSIYEQAGYDSLISGSDLNKSEEEKSSFGLDMTSSVISYNTDKVRRDILSQIKDMVNQSQSDISKLNKKYKDDYGVSLYSSINEEETSKNSIIDAIDNQLAILDKRLNDQKDRFSNDVKDYFGLSNTSDELFGNLSNKQIQDAIKEPLTTQILSELRDTYIKNDLNKNIKDNFSTAVNKHIESLQRFADTEKTNTDEQVKQDEKDTIVSQQNKGTPVADSSVQSKLRTIPTKPINDSQAVSETSTIPNTVTPEITKSVSNVPQNRFQDRLDIRNKEISARNNRNDGEYSMTGKKHNAGNNLTIKDFTDYRTNPNEEGVVYYTDTIELGIRENGKMVKLPKVQAGIFDSKEQAEQWIKDRDVKTINRLEERSAQERINPIKPQSASEILDKNNTIVPETTKNVSNRSKNISNIQPKQLSPSDINSTDIANEVIQDISEKDESKITSKDIENLDAAFNVIEPKQTITDKSNKSDSFNQMDPNTDDKYDQAFPDDGSFNIKINQSELDGLNHEFEYPKIPLDVPFVQPDAMSEENLVTLAIEDADEVRIDPNVDIQGENVAEELIKELEAQLQSDTEDSVQPGVTQDEITDSRIKRYLDLGFTLEEAQEQINDVADIKDMLGWNKIGIVPQPTNPADLPQIFFRVGRMLARYMKVGVRNLNTLLQNAVNDFKGAAPDKNVSNIVYMSFRNMLEFAEMNGEDISNYIDGYDSFDAAKSDAKLILDNIFNKDILPVEEPKVITSEEVLLPINIIESPSKLGELKVRLRQGLKILVFNDNEEFRPKLFGNNQSEFDSFIREAGINGTYQELNNKLKNDSNGFINNSDIHIISIGFSSDSKKINKNDLNSYNNQYLVYLLTDKRDGKRYANVFPSESTFMKSLDDNISVGQYDSFMDMSNSDGLTKDRIREEAKKEFLLYRKNLRDLYEEAASLNGHEPNDWKEYLKGSYKVSPVTKRIKYVTNNLKQQSPGIRNLRDVKGLPVKDFSKIKPGSEFNETTMPLFIMKGDVNDQSIPVSIINYKGLPIASNSRNILVESGRVYTGAGNTPTIMLTNKKIGEFPNLAELIYDLITKQRDSDIQEAKNLKGDPLHFTPYKLINFLIGRNKFFKSDADKGSWGFHTYDDNGVKRYRIGYESYDSNTLMDKNKVLEAIKQIPFNGRYEKLLFGLNPGENGNDVTLKNSELADYAGGDIKITDDLVIKNDQLNDGTTWLGWYVNNGVYTVNIADNPLVKSIELSDSFKIVDNSGYSPKISKTEPIRTVTTKQNKIIITDENKDLLDDLYGSVFRMFNGKYKAGNMSKEKENLRQILGDSFVDSSVKVVDDIITIASKGIKAFGVTRNDSILLYKHAEEGTGYHEAYHRVSLLLMDKKERESLYDSFRKANPLYKNYTNKQVEEELAEGFRNYVLTDGYSSAKTPWYSRLYEFVKRMFNIGDSRIKHMYNKIYRGDFSSINPIASNINEFNNEYGNAVPFNINGYEFNTIPTYSTLNKINKNLLGTLLLKNNIKSYEDVDNGTIDFNLAFELLENRVNNPRFERFHDLYNEILSNKDYFIDELKRKLAALNINVYDEIDQNVEQKEESEEPRGYDKESTEVNMRDYAPLVVKLFLGTVPKQIITENGIHPYIDPYTGMVELYDYAESYKRVANIIHSANSVKEMIDAIQRKGKTDPYFASLYDKLQRYYKNLSDQVAIENFNTKLYQTLHMFSYNYVKSNVYSDNEIMIQDANLDQHVNRKTTEWNSMFVESSGLFNKDENGLYVPIKDKIDSVISDFDELSKDVVKAYSEYENEFTQDIYKSLSNRLYSILVRIGITFPEANGDFIDDLLLSKYGDRYGDTPEAAIGLEGLNLYLSSQSRDSRGVQTGSIYNFFMRNLAAITKEGLPKSALSGGGYINTLDIFKSRPFIKELAAIYGQTYPGTESDMTQIPGGGKRFKYSLNSYITDRISNISDNKDGILNTKKLVPYSQNSLILKALLDQNGNRTKKRISLETYTGLAFVGTNDKGRDYTKITPLEDYCMKMSAIMYNSDGTNGNSRLLLPILADRKTTHFLNVDGLYLPHGSKLLEFEYDQAGNKIVPIFAKPTKEIFKGYFIDELNAIKQAASLLQAIDDAKTEKEKKALKRKLVSQYHNKGTGLLFRYFKSLSIDGSTFINMDDLLKDSNGKVTAKSILDGISTIQEMFFNNDMSYNNDFDSAINNMLNDLVVKEIEYAISIDAVTSSTNVSVDGTINFSSLYGTNKIGQYTLPKSIYTKLFEQYSKTYGNTANGLAVYNMIADYTVNNIISMNEFEKMFGGDPAFHKDNDAYIKRKAIMASTGNTPRPDLPEGLWGITDFEQYNTAEMSDSMVVSDYYNDLLTNFKERFYEESKEIFPDDIYIDLDGVKKIVDNDDKRRKYAEEASKKALAVMTYDDKGNPQINQGDGGVYISPTMFKKLKMMDDGWTQELEDAFQILESDDEWWTSPSKTLKVAPLVFQPLKYVSYNTIYETMPDGSLFEKIVADKMALFTVWKRTATGDMSALYNRMNSKSDPLDMVKFNSAVKAGSSEMFDMYEDVDHTKLSDLDKNVTSYKQNFSDIRKQLITDPHNTDDSSFGTQVIKAAMSNVIKDRIYTDINIDGREDWTGRELTTEIMRHINSLSDTGAKELMNEFGSVVDGNFVINEAKVSKMLIKEAESAGMTSNVMDALKINPYTGLLNTRLSALSEHTWLQSRLISLMNDKTINVHSAGGAMIQQSSFGLVNNDPNLTEEQREKLINKGRKLRFLNKNGSMDAVVSINMFKGVLKSAGKWNNVSHQERVIWLKEAGIIGDDASPAVLGYRIPTQGQSSISSLTIVDVLPENVADTIILPDEFTALTGSDFDIDKLYVSRYYYNKDGSKVQFKTDLELSDGENIYDKNSKEANINRMIDIYMGLLNSKYHIHETRMPLDNPVNHLKNTVLKDIRKYKDNDNSYLSFEYLTPHYQLQKKDEYFTGKSGLGPFALNNVHHVLTQLVDLHFNQTADGVVSKYNIGNLNGIIGSDNYKILDWLNAMISAHVDVAKDSYVIKLGVNPYTYNMTNLLIRTGKGSATFYLLSQDIIKDISSAAQKANGKLGKEPGLSIKDVERRNIKEVFDKYYSMLKTQLEFVDGYDNIDDLIIDTDEISDVIFKYNNEGQPTFLRKALSRKFLSEIEIKEEVLKSVKEYHFDNKINDQSTLDRYADKVENKLRKNNIDYCIEQLRLYHAFMEMKPYADELAELVTVSQVDTKKYGNNFIDMRLFMNRISKIMSYSSFDDVKGLFDKTFLGKKINNSLKLLSNMFKDMLIVTTDKFAIEHNQLLDLVGASYTRDNVLSRNLANAIEGQFKSEFFNNYTKDNNISIIDLFFGENSLPNRLNHIKADIASGKYPDLLEFPNALLDRLTGLTQGNKYDAHGIRTRIVFDNGSDVKNDLVLSWSDLLNSEYPEIQKLAKDMVIFAFYASQDKPNKNTFFDLVPYQYREEIGYNDFIAKKERDYVNGITNFDIDDIFQNNWANDNIVPEFDSKNIITYTKYNIEMPSKIRVPQSFIPPHTIVNKRNVNINRTNRFGQNLYRPYFKYKIGSDIYLYRLSGTSIIQNEKGNNMVVPVYRLITKAGFHSPNAHLYLYDNTNENNKIASNYIEHFKKDDFFTNPNIVNIDNNTIIKQVNNNAGLELGIHFDEIIDIVPNDTIYELDKVKTESLIYNSGSIITNEKGVFRFNTYPVDNISDKVIAEDVDSTYIFVDSTFNSSDINNMSFSKFRKYVDSEIRKAKLGILDGKNIKYLGVHSIGMDISSQNNTYRAYLNNRLLEIGINNFTGKPESISGNINDLREVSKRRQRLNDTRTAYTEEQINVRQDRPQPGDTLESFKERNPDMKWTVVNRLWNEFINNTNQSNPLTFNTYTGFITSLNQNQIFVFGSNTQGRHGAGAAKQAMSFGAVYGQSRGLQGQSYALITKDLTKSTHPSISKDNIIDQIKNLYSEANSNKDKEYLIAYNGKGNNLNGYSNQEMAEMFRQENIPNNIVFEESFNKLVRQNQPVEQIQSDEVINKVPVQTVFESSQTILPDWDNRIVRFFTDRRGNFIEGQLLNQGVWDNNPLYQDFLRDQFNKLNAQGAIFSLYNMDAGTIYNMYTDVLAKKYPKEAGSISSFVENWNKLSEQAKNLIIDQILNCL